MSLQLSANRLHDAARQLRVRWLGARERWRDDVALRFERERLDPMAPHVSGACSAMSSLAEVVARVRHECG